MLENILNLLFPKKCHRCQKPGKALCASCLDKIHIAKNTEINNIFAVFDYGDNTVRKAIRDLKYYRKSELAKALLDGSIPYITEYIATKLQNIKPEQLILVPVPEHSKKIKIKGFNQSEKIAKWLSTKIEGFAVKNILIKKVETLPQAKMKRGQRLTNLINTMEVRNYVDPRLNYVIIDDVTTTGATFIEARRALKEAGAYKIICIAIAHGYAKANK